MIDESFLSIISVHEGKLIIKIRQLFSAEAKAICLFTLEAH